MYRSFFKPAAKAALSIAALGASVLIAGNATAQTTVPSFNAPGIPQAGFPDFVNLNNVNLQFGQINFFQQSIGGYSAGFGDYVLSASASTTYFNLSSTAAYGVSNGSFTAHAVFSPWGQFISGSETITGSIPTLGVAQQTLYSASFGAFGVSTSNTALGFQTLYSTASGWAKKYESSNESMYLFSSTQGSLDNALKSGFFLPDYFSTTSSEITTVPLPAAAWLFGPALAALFGVARRRRSSSELLAAPSA